MNRPTISDRLLGMSKAEARPPNTFSLARYLFIFGVLLFGMIYAAPNLYPPDYALQIRPDASDATIDQTVLDRALKVLEANHLAVRGSELNGKEALIRMA